VDQKAALSGRYQVTALSTVLVVDSTGRVTFRAVNPSPAKIVSAVDAGAHQLIRAAPRLGFTVGVLLALLGLAGRSPRVRLHLPAIAPRTGAAMTSPGRWALFGVGYAAASLACTIAVLLAVITQAQASTTIGGQVVVFAAYATGAIALLLVLSAAAALAGSALFRWARATARYQARLTGTLLVLTGGYVATYWWPAVTGKSPTGHGLTAIDRWSATTTTWLQAHTGAVASAALALIILAALSAIAAHLRHRSRTAASAITSTGTAAAPHRSHVASGRDDHTTASILDATPRPTERPTQPP
jgi:hypothetical protein